MNRFLKFMPAALLATAATLTFSACDDDDELNNGNNGQPSVENVFTEGLPSKVDGATFTTNEKGQLTKIVDGTSSITFEYGTFVLTRANNFTVLMKERDSQHPNEGSDIYMELNKQGFVSYAYEVYLDDKDEDEADKWWFEYNTDGQLTKLKRSEGEDVFNITYKNGDIVKVTQDEEDGDHREYTINYTNSEYKNPVANKGCLMLFDDFFQIDMDEMGIVYFAGLLGKATKNLPMGYTENSKEGGDTYTYTCKYNWIFNTNNLPTKFWEGDYESDAVTFTWK